MPVALLGAALGLIPAMASSEVTPTVKAVETGSTGSYSNPYAWSPTEVGIAPGGQVTFANSTAGVPHGIVWTSTAKPSCEASVPDGEGGKEASSSASWSGACTFAAAGTYAFRCSVHNYMMGTVTVSGSTTTGTTTTGVTSPPPTTTTEAAAPPPSPESPIAGKPSQALKLARSQRGGSVRGSIAISNAGAGGRLEVDLFAQSASLAATRRRAAARVRVGRLVRLSLRAGKVSFIVPLDARARRALRRHRRLALSVKVVVTPTAGKPLTIARSVVEHV